MAVECGVIADDADGPRGNGAPFRPAVTTVAIGKFASSSRSFSSAEVPVSDSLGSMAMLRAIAACSPETPLPEAAAKADVALARRSYQMPAPQRRSLAKSSSRRLTGCGGPRSAIPRLPIRSRGFPAAKREKDVSLLKVSLVVWCRQHAAR